VKKDYLKKAASATTPALPQAVTVALAELAVRGHEKVPAGGQ